MESKAGHGHRVVLQVLVCCLMAAFVAVLCSLAVSGNSRPDTDASRALVAGKALPLPETTWREDEAAFSGKSGPLSSLKEAATHTWQLSSHGGGAVFAVETTADYAFAGVGPRLVVFDVSSPSEPAFIWQSPVFPGGSVDVDISGNYASVSYSNLERDGGLVVYDISDATKPVELAHYVIAEQVDEIDATGRVVFACSEGALSVFDLADPDRQPAARYTEWQCHDIKIVEQYAYVAAGDRGLYILDISDPLNPVQKGATTVDAYAYDIDVSGSFAYLINSTGMLSIVDTSVVTAPVPIPSYSDGRSIRDIVVDGDYAWIAGSYVLDVSDPYNPVPEETLILGSAISISGSRLYVASGAYEPGLVVYDISQPNSTSELGRYDTAGEVLDLVRSDNLLYVADYRAGVRAFDMSNPDRPVETASLDPGYVRRLAVANGYVLAAGNGLHILDGVSLQKVSSPVSGAVTDVLVDQDRPFAYLATGAGLDIVDLSDPDSIRAVGNYPGIAVNSFAISGTYALCAAGYSGLQIIDVSKPFTPTFVSRFEVHYASSVAVDGTVAYVVGSNVLRIVDISDIENPVELTPTPYYLDHVQEVALYMGLLYVRVTIGDLTVLDVSDPGDPRQVGFYATANQAYIGSPNGNVRVDDGYVYLADSFSGFYILGRCGTEFLCVSGSVRDDTGRPISGVNVSAGTGRSAVTSPTGAYTITNLITGTYTIFARKSGHDFSPSARVVRLPPSAIGHDFSTVPLYGSLIGRITQLGSGAAVANARVSAAGQVARSDVNGYYNLTDLLPGLHNIYVSAHGYGDYRGEAMIDAHTSTVIDVALVPINRSGYYLPYAGGRTYQCTQGNDGAYSHQGNWYYAFDFGMPDGHHVVASRGGRVVAVKDDSNSGCGSSACIDQANYVRVRHDDGTDTLYYHLKYRSAIVQEGDFVARGAVIAQSNTTGWCTGPHLDFTRHNWDQWKSISVSFADVPVDGVPKTGGSYTSGNYLTSQSLTASELTVDVDSPRGSVDLRFTGQPTHTLVLSAFDYLTDVSNMRLAATERDLQTASWTSFITRTTWTDPAVFAQYRDASGNVSAVVSDTLDAIGYEPLQAAFVVSSTVCVDQELPLTNQTTPFCEQCDWLWDFGDGTSSKGVEPVFGYLGASSFAGYEVPGAYSVTLTVKNATNAVSVSQQVEALARPLADFTLIRSGDAITVEAAATDAADWAWDFGDGVTATGRIATHTYADTALMRLYPVQLLVEGANSCTSWSHQYIPPHHVYLPLVLRDY